MSLTGNRLFTDDSEQYFLLADSSTYLLWYWLGMFIGVAATTDATGGVTYAPDPTGATQVPLTAVPASATCTVTPASYSVNSTTLAVQASTDVTFSLYDLTPNQQYTVYKNGLQLLTATTDSTGLLTWSNATWSGQDSLVINQSAPPIAPNEVFAQYSPNTQTANITLFVPDPNFPCMVLVTEDAQNRLVVTPGDVHTVINNGSNLATPIGPVRHIFASFLNNGSSITFTAIVAAQADVKVSQGGGANLIHFADCTLGFWQAPVQAGGNAFIAAQNSTFGPYNAKLPIARGSSPSWTFDLGGEYVGLSSVEYTVLDATGSPTGPPSFFGVTPLGNGVYTVEQALATTQIILWDNGFLPYYYGASSDGILLADFGKSYTGSTCTYVVYASDGSVAQAQSPASFEIAGTGIFGAPKPPLAPGFVGTALFSIPGQSRAVPVVLPLPPSPSPPPIPPIPPPPPPHLTPSPETGPIAGLGGMPIQPVGPGGTMNLILGNDYTGEDNESPTWFEPASLWTAGSGTVVLVIGSNTLAGSMVKAAGTGSGQAQVPIGKDQVAYIGVGQQPYILKLTLTDGTVTNLASGMVLVRPY